MVSMDSVSPTVATASELSFATQKTSTKAKRDSPSVSRTIGMASSTMARLRFPRVKSWCVPRMASRTDAQKLGDSPAATTLAIKDSWGNC